MTSTDPGGNPQSSFKDELRQRLVSQAGEQINKRKRRRRAGVIGAWVAVAGIGASSIFALNPEPAQASVITVIREGEFQVIQLTELDAQPSEVSEALKDAGIKGDIVAVPVAPSAVGEFFGASTTNQTVDPIDEASGTFTGFRVESGAEFQVAFGRAAQPGERYEGSADAYLDGNLFHCSKLWGAPAQAARDFASQHGITVRFQSPGNPELTRDPDAPAGLVTDATQQSSNEVLVFVADAPASPLLNSESTGPTDCQ